MSAENIRKSIDQDRDMAAKKVELEKLYGGYFGSPENCALIVEHIPEDIFRIENPVILDAGSSQGTLGEYVKNEFMKHGSTPRLLLADTNMGALRGTPVEAEKIVADLTHIPLADSSINVALLRSVLHYTSDRETQTQILKELHRVLAPEGVLISQFASFTGDEEAEAFNQMFKFLGRDVGFVSKDSGIKMHQEIFEETNKMTDGPPFDETIAEFSQRVGRDESERIEPYLEEHEEELQGVITHHHPAAWRVGFTIVSCRKTKE